MVVNPSLRMVAVFAALATPVLVAAQTAGAGDNRAPTVREGDARSRISWWDIEGWADRDDRRALWEREWRSFGQRHPDRMPTELALKLFGPDWVRRNQSRVVLGGEVRSPSTTRALLRELASRPRGAETRNRTRRQESRSSSRRSSDSRRRDSEAERERAWYREVFSRLRRMQLEELEGSRRRRADRARRPG